MQIKMHRVLYIFVIVILVRVNGLNEILRGIHPLYGISSLSVEMENKTMCYDQLETLQRDIDQQRYWAIKALDASGKPETGFIYGNNLWIGSHSQCQDISNTKKFEINHEKVKHSDPTPYDYPPFPMGFTMVYINHNSTLQYHTQLPLEWTIQLGLCLPRSCSKEEIFNLSKTYFEGEYLEMQKIYQLKLEVTEVKPLTEGILWFFKLPKTIIFTLILLIVTLLAIVGTICDVKRHNMEKNFVTGHNRFIKEKESITISTVELVSKKSTEDVSTPSTFEQVVKCFSVYSNTKNLMKTKLSADSVSCIHGLRFLGMLWVIEVHSIYFEADFLRNAPFAFRLSEDIFAQTLSNATYAVDTYLFMSGFLVTFLYYKVKNPHEKSEKAVKYVAKAREFLMMYINRFCRLTPPYLIIILFTNLIYTLYRQSSSVMSFERPDVVCDEYWWRNLLYINNLYPRTEMCLSWSWYLSLDTQFFTITAFLLILSTIAFKISAIIVFLLILISVAATVYKSYSIGYIPTMDEQLAQLDAIYDLPWNRIGPYLVGVITAYILVVKLHMKLALGRRTRIILWTFFPLLNLWIVFTLYTRQISVEFSAVYMGISRTLWGVGIGWILIACCTGNAQALQKLLSFRGFIPLSRMTYCAYLLNPVVANMIYFGSETAYNASLAGFALTNLGVMLITFFMSFLFAVLVESPFILLTKMAFKRITNRKKPTESTTSTLKSSSTPSDA